MIQPNTVITGDSLTVLRSMDDESVDMVITDPPYGIDYQSGRKEKERRLAKIKNDKAPFIWWIYDAARVVKRGGGVLCFARWDVQQTFADAPAARRPDSQVGDRVGQEGARHGRPQGLLRPAL